MTQSATAYVVGGLVLLCRTGGCLMLMPGLSSPRIPMHVRLFITVAITAAVLPLLLPVVTVVLADRSQVELALLVSSEVMTGVVIGLLVRLYFLALQLMAVAIAMYMGSGTMPGAPVDDAEPLPAVATLVMLTATTLFFLTEQHWEVLHVLIASYTVLPPGQSVASADQLHDLTSALASASSLALQISAPFLLYSVLMNILFGLANKLSPQIPAYFVSIPFVLAGGTVLLLYAIADALRVFNRGVANWIGHL